MYKNWKSVLYQYVDHKNQAEVDYTLDPIIPLLVHETLARRQQVRLKRLQQWHQARGVKPLRNETRLVLRHVSEQSVRNQPMIEAHLDLKRKFIFNTSHGRMEEERLELEKLTLLKQGDRWFIASIREEVPERQYNEPEMAAHDPFAKPQQFAEIRPRSMPLLNPMLRTQSMQPAARGTRYDRDKARQYAERWWNGANPAYLHFGVDCTNYISQCLFAGGAPMNYTGKRETGWWYQGKQGDLEHWSFSWSVANSLQWHLSTSKSGLRAMSVSAAQELEIGDVILYDWDGDQRFQHSTVVTAMDMQGMPLVNAHTADCRNRYWDYQDSYAWSTNTQYRFFHISDEF